MTAIARPVADVTATSVTGTPVATNNQRWQNVGELVPSDTSCVYGANNAAATHTVRLGTVDDPGVSDGHVFRYRVAKTNAGALSDTGNAVSATISLLQGTTVIASDVARVLTGEWVLYERALSAAEADAITDYTDLRLRLVTTASGGTTANRRGGAWSWCALSLPGVAFDALTRATRHHGLINAAPNKSYSWTADGITYTVSDPGLSGSVVSVVATASDARGPLPVDTEWAGQIRPYAFVNPGLMAPDGGQEWVLRDAVPALQPTWVRDDILAFKTHLQQAVLGYALRHGWTPA